MAAFTWWAFNLPAADAFLAVIAPLIAPARELVEMIRANIDSAQSKATTEGKILAYWRRGLKDPTTVSEQDCRSIQDRMLNIRQTNANIPDWLNSVSRNKRQAAMGVSVAHMIEEARDHGAVDRSP
jgi:hypothetical protein